MLVKNSLLIFNRDIILTVIKLATIIIVARNLGDEVFGVFIILQMIPSYAEAIGRFKFELGAIYFLGAKKYLIQEVLPTLNWLAIFASFVVCLIYLVNYSKIQEYLFNEVQIDVYMLSHLVLLQVPLQFLFLNYSYLAIQTGNVKLFNGMIIIQTLMTSIFSMFGIFLTDFGLAVVVVAVPIGTLFGLVFGLSRLGPISLGFGPIRLDLVLELVRYCKNLYFSGILGHAQLHAGHLISVAFVSPAHIGFLQLAKIFSQTIDRFPSALNAVLFPELSKISNEAKTAHLTAKSMRILLVLLSLVGFLGCLFLIPFVALVFSEAFEPIIVCYMLLTVGCVLAGTTSPINQYLMATGHTRLIAILSIPPCILNVALSIVLIPVHGIYGAALSTSLSFILISILYILSFKMLTGLFISQFLVWEKGDWNDVKFFFSQFSRGLNK